MKLTAKKVGVAILAMGVAIGLSACSGSATEQSGDSAKTEEQSIAGDAAGDVSPEQDGYVDKMDRRDEGLKLVWNDEFDGDSPDATKWDYQYGTGAQYGLDGWGNSELRHYTDRTENMRVEDGKLFITANKEESAYEGMKYTSGRIRTMTSEDEEIFSTTCW